MLTRRRLLQGAAALPLGQTVVQAVQAAQEAAPPAAAATLAFVGGYAPQAQGIQSFAQDGARLRPLQLSANPHNPSWLQLSHDGRHLYAANEHEDHGGRRSGSVSSYEIDARSGALRPLATVASGGAGPVHLSLHPQGRHAFVAHYGSGQVAVLPRAADGSLGAPVQSLLPAQAAAAPGAAAGRVSRAHMALPDPSGRFVLVSDLGLDLITVWRFDAERGRLVEPQTQALPPGSGPRHLAFHPQLPQQLYVLTEQSSSLLSFGFDARSGRLTPQSALSSLPAGFQGSSYASDLRLARDGRHLYALNRLHDSIAIFALDAAGQPRWQGEVWARGSYPRACAFDPSGEHLYVCNQRSNHLTVFRVGTDGGLSFTGDYLAAGAPAVITFLAPPASATSAGQASS